MELVRIILHVSGSSDQPKSAAGILQLLLSCPYPLIQKHMWDIIKTAEWLAGLQDEIGNWPTKCPEDYRDGGVSDNELVQYEPQLLITFCPLD